MWYNRKFSQCKALKTIANCEETETQNWTWDMRQKVFDPSHHKNMSPLWWAIKRGFFYPPSQAWTNVCFLLSNFFGRKFGNFFDALCICASLMHVLSAVTYKQFSDNHYPCKYKWGHKLHHLYTPSSSYDTKVHSDPTNLWKGCGA